jgi:hypothetical protein
MSEADRKQVAIYTELGSNLDCMTLEQAAEFLAGKAKATPGLKLEERAHEWDEGRSLYVVSYRLETDQELHARLEKEAQRAEYNARTDAAEYARLKKKFEGTA